LKIAIVSDHGGLDLKNYILNNSSGISYINLGVNDLTSVDYPTVIGEACQKLLKGEFDKMIALCGTGIGASMIANRFKGIRAALCHDEFTAEMAKRHNDANVLVLGGRVLGGELSTRIINKWLSAEFEGGRHAKRIQLLDS
jgi:ribose 5-phosphate isomerase B